MMIKYEVTEQQNIEQQWLHLMVARRLFKRQKNKAQEKQHFDEILKESFPFKKASDRVKTETEVKNDDKHKFAC